MEKPHPGDTDPRKEENVLERRLSKPEDFEFARKTHHESYHDVVVKQFGSWDEKLQDGFFDEAWNGSPHEIILCNGEMCGYFSMEETSDTIELHELVILPKFQGKGIGGKLLREAIEMATKKNKRVHLQVLKKNNAAELYRRAGFKEIEEDETHFQMEYDPIDRG